MSKGFEIQELAIAINAKNLNPNVINADFLKYTGIVPADWELSRQPVYANGLVQIFFSTGVGIVAQPNSITVVEAIATKQAGEIQVAKITEQLIGKLSQVEYQRVGINPRGFVVFNSDAEAYQYIHSKLLAPGSWQEFAGGKVTAGLQLSYPLKRGILNLNINQANVQFPDKVAAAILFSGNFNYPLSGETPGEKSQDLQTIIQDWQNSVKTFQQLLSEKFFQSPPEPSKNISVFPPMAKS
jgi:hypothetical protein